MSTSPKPSASAMRAPGASQPRCTASCTKNPVAASSATTPIHVIQRVPITSSRERVESDMRVARTQPMCRTRAAKS
jgi:hypothetical protein